VANKSIILLNFHFSLNSFIPQVNKFYPVLFCSLF